MKNIIYSSKEQNKLYSDQNAMENFSTNQDIEYLIEPSEPLSDSFIGEYLSIDINSNTPMTDHINTEAQDTEKCIIVTSTNHQITLVTPSIAQTQYSLDNLIKLFKTFLHKVSIEYINRKILERLNLDENLCPIKAELNANPSISANRDLLNTPMRVYLSQDISPRFTTKCPDHNRKLIQYLVKNKLLSNILNKTYLDFVRAFRGDELEEPRFDCIRDFRDYYPKLGQYLVQKHHDEAYIKAMNNVVGKFEFCFVTEWRREFKFMMKNHNFI